MGKIHGNFPTNNTILCSQFTAPIRPKFQYFSIDVKNQFSWLCHNQIDLIIFNSNIYLFDFDLIYFSKTICLMSMNKKIRILRWHQFQFGFCHVLLGKLSKIIHMHQYKRLFGGWLCFAEFSVPLKYVLLVISRTISNVNPQNPIEFLKLHRALNWIIKTPSLESFYSPPEKSTHFFIKILISTVVWIKIIAKCFFFLFSVWSNLIDQI